jgi:prepilin-type N-terminal cleavage/methylation domain-containing protein/prepilin-type processing-associated H-X9-DG protein
MIWYDLRGSPMITASHKIKKQENIMEVSELKNPASKIFSVRKYFTLIELLIVIAIIGILVAMLLPALKKAKDVAKSISCVGKLKQTQLAYMSYLSDSSGNIPMIGVYPDECSPAGNDYGDGGYYGVIAEYLGDMSGNNNFVARKGASATVDTNKAFFCTATETNPPFKVGTTYYSSYGYNRCVIIVTKGAGAQKIEHINSPERTLFMFDGYYLGMESTVYLGNPYTYLTGGTRLNFLAHNRGANVSFMDGHVDFVPVTLANNRSWFAKRKYNSTHDYLW